MSNRRLISAGKSGNFGVISQPFLFRFIMSSVNCFRFATFYDLASPDAPEGSTSWVWGVECLLPEFVFSKLGFRNMCICLVTSFSPAFCLVAGKPLPGVINEVY